MPAIKNITTEKTTVNRSMIAPPTMTWIRHAVFARGSSLLEGSPEGSMTLSYPILSPVSGRVPLQAWKLRAGHLDARSLFPYRR